MKKGSDFMTASSLDPLATPKRVAFIADWHMNTRWAIYAIEYAASMDADVIIHLGDYGYTFEKEFVQGVEQALAKAKIPLLFVDGNHEHFGKLYKYPVQSNGLRKLTSHVFHLPRGFRWTWNGVEFLAMGGAHSVDRPFRVPGISWWKEETITREELDFANSGGPTDVLVSHECPKGVIIPGIDDRTTLPPFPPLEIMKSNDHRELFRELVDATQPKDIFHGHYHTHYHQDVDFGYGDVHITGLDCDGTKLEDNVHVIDMNYFIEKKQNRYPISPPTTPAPATQIDPISPSL